MIRCMKVPHQKTSLIPRLAATFLVGFLFLAATVNSGAAVLPVGTAAGQVIHDIQFYENLLNKGKMMVIVPEPSAGVLLASGGLIGLAAWRLRKRAIARAGN